MNSKPVYKYTVKSSKEKQLVVTKGYGVQVITSEGPNAFAPSQYFE